MYLGRLKELLFHPDEEFVINKKVNIRGEDVLLLSFTKENNRGSLWIMKKRDIAEEDIYELESKTRRKEKLDHIESSNRNPQFFINKMEIQGISLEFDTASNYYIAEDDVRGVIKLLHFIELGLIPEEWDSLELENLVITQYQQKEGDIGQNIDTTKDLSIVLYIGQDIRQVPILHSFKIQMGKYDKGKKIVYYDKELGRESCFYINEIGSYDPYEDIENKVKIIEDMEQREKILNDLISGLEEYCPRGKSLAFIEYETEDDTQLEFYLKEYLDSSLVIHEYNTETGVIGRSTGFMVLAMPDKDRGINGYKLRACMMQAIDKDFEGELEIELFSRYLTIPEEKIEVF